MDETSDTLRRLSSQLHAHLYLIPLFDMTSKLFRLPSKERLLSAASALIGLSNSVYRADNTVYEVNAKRVEQICDSLGIYLSEGARLPKDLK